MSSSSSLNAKLVPLSEQNRSKFDQAREQALKEDVDVGGIGKHCQLEDCRQLDFLPFRCESCKGTFCLDHRTESAHNCSKAGSFLHFRPALSNASSATSTKSGTSSNYPLCASSACKTRLNPSTTPSSTCPECKKTFCLKHRLPGSQHECSPPVSSLAGVKEKSDKLTSALARFKAWANPSGSSSPSNSSSSTSSRARQSLATLKSQAVGDPKTPVQQRVYLSAQAAGATSLKTGVFYFPRTQKVGRVLDQLCSKLGVKNENNVSTSKEGRLCVYWVDGGRVLGMGEEIGVVSEKGVGGVAEVVVLRGVEA